MIPPGSSVTWGSGAPRGTVVDTFSARNTFTGADETFATVRLTGPVNTPCGRTWSPGTEVRMPLSELRLLG